MLSPRKSGFFEQKIKLFFIDSHHGIPIINICFFMVTLLEILLWTGPILEFKRGFLHPQKGHPTLVAQVDLILEKDE